MSKLSTLAATLVDRLHHPELNFMKCSIHFRMASAWLLAVCILLVCCDTEAHLVCVCPDEQCLFNGNSCFPFQMLVQEQEFSPDTDVFFSSGTYTIWGNDSVNYNMVVRDTRDIRLLGDPSGATIIQCDGRLRFNFINITNLTITDIQFVSCGAPWRLISREPFQARIPENNPAALLLVNVYDLLMSNVVITVSHGYGMLCINLFGESHIMNTKFTSNNKYHADSVGGSILLVFRDNSLYPVAEQVRILVNNCSFIDCGLTYELPLVCPKIPSASGLGIVIKQTQYSINVILNHTHFIDNYAPVLAVYSHDTPGSYNILIQHSHFMNSFRRGDIRFILWKTATIKFMNLLSEHPLRANTTTRAVKRTIDIQNNVFTSPINDRYGFIEVGYIDITVFLNVTITIKKCTFLASITTAAIYIRSILYDQRVKPDYDQFVKSIIVECNFTGLQGGAIAALITAPVFATKLPGAVYEPCYRHFIDSNEYSASNIIPCDQISLLIENTTFINNTGSAAMKVAQVSNVTIANSKFIKNEETALESKGSVIYIRGTVIFLRNKGFNGGALSLTMVTKHTINQREKIKYEQISLLYLHPNARLLLMNNKATNKGGAIYVDTGEVNGKERHESCFYQLLGYVLDHENLPNIVFVNNIAGFAGDSVYGGFDKKCHLQTPVRNRLKTEDFFTISNQSSISEMATDPDRLCFCHGLVPKCSMSIQVANLSVHQGQTVHINAIAVGRNNHYMERGASPALVIARIDPEYETKLSIGQYGQNLENRCSQLTFSIHSCKTNVEIQLFVNSRSELGGLLNISVLGCPFGFQLQDSIYPVCVCETIIEESGCTCSIDDLVISCPFGKWIGNISGQAIVHHHCPFDYCISDGNVRVMAIGEQCAFNHSGLLCGECQPGLSLGFGSSICKECTNTYLLLIFPFALAGLGLVLLLFACDLTVSRGTVNGLIYFANVVQVNSSVFITQNTPQFFTVFVAWVNLDLGFWTCFYNGMDMYAKAWLQFIFPVYMWLIVATVVLLSRYSMTVSRMIRDNTVPVLATLFLLSYAKLLRAIITAFSFTYLRYPDRTRIPVWMYDGNVPFAKGKHIALFVAALVAMFGFIIPYTLLLVFSPYLQRWSHYKLLAWVNKLKPFLDANHGPYKNKIRNWTGIILLVRAVQFICFAANAEGDPNINLMVILLIGVTPYLVIWIFGTVYKTKANSILESAFVILLSTLVSASLYTRTTSLDVEGKRTVITSLIFAAAFFLFLVIIAYHSFIQIKSTASKLCMCRNVPHTLTTDSSATKSSIELASDHPSVSYIALGELSPHTDN